MVEGAAGLGGRTAGVMFCATFLEQFGVLAHLGDTISCITPAFSVSTQHGLQGCLCVYACMYIYIYARIFGHVCFCIYVVAYA